MPAMEVFADDIVTKDLIEIGGTEAEVLDVEIDYSNRKVIVTLSAIGSPEWMMILTLPAAWPTRIRRK